MLSNKKYIVLFDVESVTDKETGDRTKKAVNISECICTEYLAGINTQMLGQQLNKTISKSPEIDRMYYSDQDYVYLDNKVYEIVSGSPAKLLKDIKLNINKLSDEDITNAIKEWLNGNI